MGDSVYVGGIMCGGGGLQCVWGIMCGGDGLQYVCRIMCGGDGLQCVCGGGGVDQNKF